MDVRDNTEFRNRLVALAEVFDVKLSPQRQALYFEALRDLSFEAVAKGLNRAVQTSTFFPKPAELRALAVGDAEDHIEAAWMLLRLALSRVGSYSSLVVAEAALGEAIVACFGSWPDACRLELSPEMWANKRKEFGRVYRVLVDRGVTGPRYLAGICESENARRAEWAKFTPVAYLTDAEILTLSSAEAEQLRMAIATKAEGFKQLAAGEHMPGREGQSA